MTASATPTPSASDHYAKQSPPITVHNMGLQSILPRLSSPPAPRPHSSWGFSPHSKPGDRVGLAVPGYPAYRNILAALGIEPVLIEVGENTHYQPNADLLAAAGPLDGLVVASPANPTGTMIGPADLARLVEYCASQGIRLVSDEIYHGITYENEAARRAPVDVTRSSSIRSQNITA